MVQPGRKGTRFDVTSELRSVKRLLTVHRGLYVQYFKNSGSDAVHDRNRESRGGGKKLLVPRGTTIKIGKFENGFLARRAADAIHMHRRPASATKPARPYSDEFVYAPALGTYMECLKRVYVLDLGSQSRSIVRQAERDLRRNVDDFLKRNGLPVRDFRGDWRLLDGSLPPGLLKKVEQLVRKEFDALRKHYAKARRKGRSGAAQTARRLSPRGRARPRGPS